MQRKSRGVLLALIAVFAMSAVTAAAASATTPEFKPVPTKKKFTGTSGTLVWTWDNGAEKITCSKGSTTGAITGARTVGGVVLVYTGCKSSSATKSNCPINSKGAKAEEIVTEPLAGELGTSVKNSAVVVLRLKAETATKWFTALENACTSRAAWTGSVAPEVSSLSKGTVHGLVLATVGGKQAITEIKLDSGELEEPELVTYASSVATETKDSLTFEEAVEIT
jgi:hypothetical protein